MLAILLSCALFVYLFLLGYPILRALAKSSDVLASAFLAPAVGAAIVIVPTFSINRLGVPVANFCIPLAVVLALLSLAMFWSLLETFPFRKYGPFALIFVVASVIAGFPLLKFGFDWISFGNDDMANYVLSAQRFLTQGALQIPSLGDFVTGRDMSVLYWIPYGLTQSRSGADLMLAFTSGLTHLNPQQVFMPVILTFFSILISATCGIVLRNNTRLLAAYGTAMLLGLSALSVFGMLYQLIAQVLGLCFFVATLTILTSWFTAGTRADHLRVGILGGFMVSAMTIAYTELLPFCVASAFIFYVVGIIRRRFDAAFIASRLGITFAAILVFLNSYVIGAAIFLLTQTTIGLRTGARNDYTFAFYLLPSGWPILWGIFPIATQLHGQGLDAGIIVGIVLSLATLMSAFYYAYQGEPVAIALLVLVAAVVLVVLHGNDFALYKLAMYVQPFLMGTVVLGWLGLTQKWRERP